MILTLVLNRKLDDARATAAAPSSGSGALPRCELRLFYVQLLDASDPEDMMDVTMAKTASSKTLKSHPLDPDELKTEVHADDNLLDDLIIEDIAEVMPWSSG